MAIRERFEYAVDLVTDGAQRGIKNVEEAVKDADGTFNKFKAGGKAAFKEIQANAGQFALIAGTAIAAFGAQSARTFQESSLEAGKFAQATGLAVEDASRWREVADDVGVSGETVVSMFTRLNKAIGSNSPVVKQLGIEMQTAADGTADVNATMLTAIERLNEIEDPAKRAAAAQALFGKGYKEASELIFGSSERLRAALESVSDAQVTDQDELDKARELRGIIDELSDAFTQLQMIVGEEVVDKLITLRRRIDDVSDAFETIPGADAARDFKAIASVVEDTIAPLQQLWGWIDATKGLIDGLIPSEKDLKDGLLDVGTSAIEAQVGLAMMAAATEEAALAAERVVPAAQQIQYEIDAADERFKRFGDDGVESMNDVEEATDDAREAFKDLRAEIKGRQDFRALEDTFSDVKAAAVDAFGAAAEGADDAGEKARNLAADQDDLRLEVLDYVEALGNIPAAKSTDIMAAIDRGAYDEALRLLTELERERIVNVRVTTGQINSRTNQPGRNYAAGTMYHPGGAASFNEPGNPEMAIFPDGQVFMPDMPAGSKVLRMNSGAMSASQGVMSGGGGGLMVVNRGVTHHHYHSYIVTGANGATAGAAQRRVRGMM